MNFILEVHKTLVVRLMRAAKISRREACRAQPRPGFPLMEVCQILGVHVEKARPIAWMASTMSVFAPRNDPYQCNSPCAGQGPSPLSTHRAEKGRPCPRAVIVDGDANVVLLHELLHAWKCYRSRIAGHDDGKSARWHIQTSRGYRCPRLWENRSRRPRAA